VTDVFKHRDKDNSGKLDEGEWLDFLQDLQDLHHMYLLATAFRQFRAFFGRGQNWAERFRSGEEASSNQLDKRTLLKIVGAAPEPDTAAQDNSREANSPENNSQKAAAASSTSGAASSRWPCNPKRLLSPKSASTVSVKESAAPAPTYSLVPEEGDSVAMEPVAAEPRFQVGWDPEALSCWKDFVFYSANNHPLHGIFSCSPDHPLSCIERLAIEAVTIMFTYITLWIADMNEDIQFTNAVVCMLIITIPGIVLWWLLFLLFTCPKLGIVNEAISRTDAIKKARSWRCIGERVGYGIALTVFLVMIGFTIFGRHYISMGWNTLLVFRGRLKGYLIFSGLQTFVYFNPLIAWGTTDTHFTTFGLIGDLIGLGQWRIERQRFKWVCARALQQWANRLHREKLLKDMDLWRQPRHVLWQFKARDWVPFNDDCQEFIEHRWQQFARLGGTRHARVHTCGFTVMIDFKTLTQKKRGEQDREVQRNPMAKAQI